MLMVVVVVVVLVVSDVVEMSVVGVVAMAMVNFGWLKGVAELLVDGSGTDVLKVKVRMVVMMELMVREGALTVEDDGVGVTEMMAVLVEPFCWLWCCLW